MTDGWNQCKPSCVTLSLSTWTCWATLWNNDHCESLPDLPTFQLSDCRFRNASSANKIQFIADISLEKCKLCLPSHEIKETAQYLLAHKETARNENSSCGIVFVVLEQW